MHVVFDLAPEDAARSCRFIVPPLPSLPSRRWRVRRVGLEARIRRAAATSTGEVAGTGPVLGSFLLGPDDRSFQFAGLEPGTQYFVSVVPVPCDPEDAAWGHRGIFTTSQFRNSHLAQTAA